MAGAATPLLLALEDLHWADRPPGPRSIAGIGLSGRTLVVVASHRRPVTPAVQATVAELVRDGATRLELGGLDRPTLAQLAAAALGEDASALDVEALDRLYERTGGNPFLVLELVGAGLLEPGDTPYAGVPPSLRDILDARLASLDDDTLEVLRAAALHPGTINDEILAAVVDRPIGAVGDALREARDLGVLATAPGAPAFRHALQRDVLVEQLGPGERRMLHGRFADALAAGGRDPSRATAVALHRDAAGDDARSLAAHAEALDASMHAFAFEAAMRHAGRAAELRARVDQAPVPAIPDAPTLLETASLAALLAGDPVRSAGFAREALALVGDDAERAASLHDRLRWALWEAGDHEGAAREVELAVARLGVRRRRSSEPGSCPSRRRCAWTRPIRGRRWRSPTRRSAWHGPWEPGTWRRSRWGSRAGRSRCTGGWTRAWRACGRRWRSRTSWRTSRAGWSARR
jgi:hypothetical protein